MLRKNQSHTPNKNENSNVENDGSTEDEKKRLKKQISELNDLIFEIEFALNLTTYGNIENVDKLKAPVEYKRSHKLKNIDYILQHELCKLSGLYCSKCTNDEFVFNFSPYSDVHSKPTYGIQFFTNNERGTIGKYVMPISGMLESIIDETPIDHVTGLIPFFRNCKRHIECFVDRKEQFAELKELTSTLKNIHLDADTGYLLITCSFLQAYKKSTDNLMDITVYLSYDYGKARPSALSVDWSMKDKPTDEHIKEMKSFVKVFRSSSLAEAYHHIKAFKHPVFAWKPQQEDDDQMPDIDEISGESTDEENEDISRPARKASRRVSRKRQRSSTPEQNDKRSRDNNKKPVGMGNAQVKERKKPKREPQQTTLNFTKQTPKSQASANDGEEKSANKLASALTSTPMHKNIKDKFKSKTPGILGISPIVAQDKGKKKVVKTTKVLTKKKK